MADTENQGIPENIKTPLWAYFFWFLCVCPYGTLMMINSLNGSHGPNLIGMIILILPLIFLGNWCKSISKRESRSVGNRVGLCCAIVLAAFTYEFIAVVLMTVILASLMSK